MPEFKESSEDMETRYEELFKKLDKGGDGRIDIKDLTSELKDLGVLDPRYAEKFIQNSDQDQSGDVGLTEFINYVKEHEKNLRLQFSHLDKNKDGKVDFEEMVVAFKELGVNIKREEAKKLFNRMDQDGSLNISFCEWRDFLLLAPSDNFQDILTYWRHSTIHFFLI